MIYSRDQRNFRAVSGTAMVLFWAQRSTPVAPTSSIAAAIALVDDVAPGTLWTLLGKADGVTATITSIGGQVVCVSADGAAPALALLAAAVKAADGTPLRATS